MASDRGKQGTHIARYRPPGVTPVEIWDFLVGDAVLSDRMGDGQFGELLFEALVALHAGRGRTASLGAIPAEWGGFDAVVLTGGRADARVLADPFAKAPFTVVCNGPDPFIGRHGGRHLLGENGDGGAVVDIGQCQIKISLADRCFTYPRDFESLPIRPSRGSTETDSGVIVSQRKRLQEFVGNSLRDACRSTGSTPAAMVMALPCEIDDQAVPGTSSYLGTDGNADLILAALRLAALNDCGVMLLNDAELAALSVALSPAASAGERILVVTLGFAVGAALLETRLWQK